MGEFVSHRAARVSGNEEEMSRGTIPCTTVVIAWGCPRYIRNERCRSNKVKYEEKERKPHSLLNSFRFEMLIDGYKSCRQQN